MSSPPLTAQGPLSPRRAIEFRRAAGRAPVGAHDGALLEVTSSALGWQGIAVEGGLMRGWEVHDLVVDQHLIALNVGSAPLSFERIEEGRTRRVTMPPGSLWVNPAGEPITHKIRAPSRFLDVTLDAAQLEVYRNLFDGYATVTIVDPRIDPLADPNRVLARWHTHAELTDGTIYDNDLIGLFEFDPHGRLRLLTEYFDPTAFSTVTAAENRS